MASSSEDVSQKFTSQGRRIHHHYDLVTVTMENVQPQSVCLYMCAEVLVLGGPWGLHSFLHIHTHTHLHLYYSFTLQKALSLEDVTEHA